MKSVKTGIKLMIAGALLFTSAAHALQGPYTATITRIEPTYLPGLVAFNLSSGPSCNAGAGYIWNRGPDNNKATYAGMIAAMLAGKPVDVWFDDADSCSAQFIHFRP